MATNGAAPPFSVEGKTAIVTGAGSGINLAFTLALLKKGCNVVMADIALRPEAQGVLDAHKDKPRAVFQKCDVTNWGDLAQIFEVANSEFGGVDICCPGAGVFENPTSNFWFPPGAEDSPSIDPVSGHGSYNTLDINIYHPIRMTQLAISHFLNPKGDRQKASPENPKRVVCIASIASEIALIAVPLYICSKWAISGFVRSMDLLEPSNGIRVNAVAPGITNTPIWTADKAKFLDQNSDKWVTPDEVADAMVKLMEDPEMVGGTVLEVGAGHTRPIPIYGNTPPTGEGHTLSNVMSGITEVFEWLKKPNWGQAVTK